MTHHTTRRPLALAAALLVASTGAAASPGGPGGPKGGPGMGGPGAPGAMVEQVIEGLRDKLSLDSAQRAMFDSAHAQTNAARRLRLHIARHSGCHPMRFRAAATNCAHA